MCRHFSSIIDKVIGGVNCSVIAYGNTGSGKTHTMYGEKWPGMIASYIKSHRNSEKYSGAEELEKLPGLILRLAKGIFERKDSSRSSLSISVKYFQIYNEKVIDLMTVKLCDPGKRGSLN